MKILFLDIDGVVNSKETLGKSGGGIVGIDSYLMFLVGRIKLDTECEIVLSSSWRNWPKGIEKVEQALGSKLYGITPNLTDGVRGWEIRTWLREHPDVSRFAILDDEITDQLLIHKDNFFQTSFETGITEEIAKSVTDYLNA